MESLPMQIYTLEQEQFLPISLDEAWDFFSSPRNLDEITPDDLGFSIQYIAGDKMYEGQIITYRIRIAPLVNISWVTEIKSVQEKESFVDEQRFGPYRLWHHRHSFQAVEGGVKMKDLVHYAMPFWLLGSLTHYLFVKQKLRRIFKHREQFLSEKFGK